MKNQILKFILIFLALILLIIIYLSTIGIETDRFNNRIKKKISQVNNNLDVDLKFFLSDHFKYIRLNISAQS